MNKREYGMGALSPSGSEWQIGKTAATIRFVNEASVYLLGKPRISPIVALTQYVERLKSGEEVLTNWLTVEEYLNSEPVNCMG